MRLLSRRPCSGSCPWRPPFSLLWGYPGYAKLVPGRLLPAENDHPFWVHYSTRSRYFVTPRNRSDPPHILQGPREGGRRGGTESAGTVAGKAQAGARPGDHGGGEGEDHLVPGDGVARRRVRDEGPDGPVHQGVAPLRGARRGEAAGPRVRAHPDGEGVRRYPRRLAPLRGARGGSAGGAVHGPGADALRES